MTKPAYLYLLDLDGTLIDSLDDLTASVNAMRREFALSPLESKAVKSMVGQGARSLVERALPGQSSAKVDDGLAIFLAHNEQHLFDRTRLYPGVATTLATLAERGQTLALISNKNEKHCRQLLVHFGIATHFSAILGGDSLPSRKPSAEPVLHAMKQLAKRPEETLMVGDSINDIVAGNGAGVMTVGCTYGYGQPPELAAATFRITAFAELLQLPP